MKKQYVFPILLCIIIAILSTCSRPQTDAKKSDGPNSSPSPRVAKVTLTASKNIWATLPIIAKEQGFFQEQGLDVKINYVQAAKLAMDALIAGSTDFANVVDPNLAFVGFSGNKDIVVVATIVKSHDSAIVARKSAGITAPQDLKGKKLGVLQGTTSQIFAERFLEKNGLRYDMVQVQNLQPIAMQTALTEKGIDAGSVWQPFVHNLQNALGNDAVVFSAPDVYTGYMNVAVNKQWADRNRDIVIRLIRALRTAQEFVQKHADAAQGTVGKEINLDPPIVKAIWGEYDFSLELDQPTLLRVISDEGQWIKRSQPGFENKEIPDYSGYIDPQFLRSATERQ